MPKQVTTGAIMTCSFGELPASFIATPKMIRSSNMDAGNIGDHISVTNIPTFGLCSAPTNPEVISATTAAQGVLTPMPCVPDTPVPWVTGALTVPTSNLPALNDTACLNCAWLGIIKFTTAGQLTHTIP